MADVVEELTNHGDEQRSEHYYTHPQRLFANSNQLFSNNDVQSMDAIERRDFINEQKATANCLLGNNSLIINGTNGDEPRLNLDLLGNSFSHKLEQRAALPEEQTTKRIAERVSTMASSTTSAPTTTATSSSTAGGAGAASVTTENAGTQSSNDQLMATPTTSRTTKRSRLSFSTGEKSALARSLEKSSNSPDKESTSIWDVTCRESPDPTPMPMSDVCNCTTDAVDDDKQQQSNSMKGICNKEPSTASSHRMHDVSTAELDEDDDDGDDDDDDDDDGEHGDGESSRAHSSRTQCSGNSSCTSTCRNRHSHSDNLGQNVSTDNPSNAGSPSGFRAGNALEDEEYEKLNIDKNFRLIMGLEPENPYADWACEVNSDGEEVCTCRDYTDNETTANSEDELPSRDVDLSCYSISGDVLNSNGNSSTETPTSRNHRKRKLTENRTSIFNDTANGCSETNSNDRKRLALDESKCNLN